MYFFNNICITIIYKEYTFCSLWTNKGCIELVLENMGWKWHFQHFVGTPGHYLNMGQYTMEHMGFPEGM